MVMEWKRKSTPRHYLMLPCKLGKEGSCWGCPEGAVIPGETKGCVLCVDRPMMALEEVGKATCPPSLNQAASTSRRGLGTVLVIHSSA